MWWIDGHLDLAYLGLRGRDLTVPCSDPEAGCVSLPDLRAGDVRIVFGTIYCDIGAPDQPYGYASSDDVDGAEQAGRRQVELYESLEEAGEISIVRSAKDLDAADDDQRIKVVILMEGADPIRSPDDAKVWFDRGVRLVGLTWAKGSRYAGGNAKHGPLTSAGRELIAELDRLGVVHDLSHLSDPAIDDLLEMTTGRVVATHSNCRTLLGDSQRHLTDEVIAEIALREGVVGVNLFTKFLLNRGRATVDEAVEHVLHITDVMRRRDGIGLGSDADGGFPPTQLAAGLEHPRLYGAMLERLRRRLWSDEELAGFAHGNWLRFLREALPDSE